MEQWTGTEKGVLELVFTQKSVERKEQQETGTIKWILQGGWRNDPAVRLRSQACWSRVQLTTV